MAGGEGGRQGKEVVRGSRVSSGCRIVWVETVVLIARIVVAVDLVVHMHTSGVDVARFTVLYV